MVEHFVTGEAAGRNDDDLTAVGVVADDVDDAELGHVRKVVARRRRESRDAGAFDVISRRRHRQRLFKVFLDGAIRHG